jgi:hypothetical protein
MTRVGSQGHSKTKNHVFILRTAVFHEELTLHYLDYNPELVLSSLRESDNKLHTDTISFSP